MPVIRNPFRRNADSERLSSADATAANTSDNHLPPKSPSAISITRSDGGEGNEYKLSEVSDNGVYLPPSPPEKRSFWRRPQLSATSSRSRLPSSPAEDQFTISRESFDSYRRSFDVSARSPVFPPSSGRASMDVHSPVRMSLDARPLPPRMSLDSRSPMVPPAKPVEESEFEDVALTDDSKPKKRGILSRFGGDTNTTDHDAARPNSRGHIFSRKGERPVLRSQDSELKPMDSPHQSK